MYAETKTDLNSTGCALGAIYGRTFWIIIAYVNPIGIKGAFILNSLNLRFLVHTGTINRINHVCRDEKTDLPTAGRVSWRHGGSPRHPGYLLCELRRHARRGHTEGCHPVGRSSGEDGTNYENIGVNPGFSNRGGAKDYVHAAHIPSAKSEFSDGLGGISWSVLSVLFTDKFALSQSDARISVAYNSCQWKTLTKRLMKCPPGSMRMTLKGDVSPNNNVDWVSRKQFYKPNSKSVSRFGSSI